MKGKVEVVAFVVMFLLGAIVTLPAYSVTNQVYLEPATLDLSGRTLGHRFCVIVWCEVGPPEISTWQVNLRFPDWLNCVKVGYCNPVRNSTYPHNWSKSEMFDSYGTVPVIPVISNSPGSKHVTFGEYLIYPGFGVYRLARVSFILLPRLHP